MARVTKCDRCGKIVENDPRHTAHDVHFVGAPDEAFRVPILDLCDECFDRLLEFWSPMAKEAE